MWKNSPQNCPVGWFDPEIRRQTINDELYDPYDDFYFSDLEYREQVDHLEKNDDQKSPIFWLTDIYSFSGRNMNSSRHTIDLQMTFDSTMFVFRSIKIFPIITL